MLDFTGCDGHLMAQLHGDTLGSMKLKPVYISHYGYGTKQRLLVTGLSILHMRSGCVLKLVAIFILCDPSFKANYSELLCKDREVSSLFCVLYNHEHV